MTSVAPFHLAFPVDDLDAARDFYGRMLGCTEGRSAGNWIDFELFGHQIVTHLRPQRANGRAYSHMSDVDGHDVPIPHFGVVLNMPQWRELARRLRDHGVRFIMEPSIRFEGQIGEQATMFFLDPSGNALEFKGFSDMSQLFAA